MKRFLVTLSLALLLLPAMAQSMYIDSKEKSTTVDFSNFEKITFNGTTVTILQSNGTASDYSMGDIERIHFGYYQSGISDNIQEEAIRHISNEEIYINANCGTMVYLYDITGTQLYSTRIKGNSTVISLFQYPGGIYIARVGEETYKIVKR